MAVTPSGGQNPAYNPLPVYFYIIPGFRKPGYKIPGIGKPGYSIPGFRKPGCFSHPFVRDDASHGFSSIIMVRNQFTMGTYAVFS
jgi:hypothetical protein